MRLHDPKGAPGFYLVGRLEVEQILKDVTQDPGKGWWDAGRFLGPSISTHYKSYPVHWTVNAWEHAGIEHVEHRSMSVGGGLVMWGYRSR